ncbi:MAG: DUF2851 family protein [Balneolales bacterium]
MTENLFQHIWSGLYFQTPELYTSCGKKVSVIHQGVQNHAGGPDFRQAEINIDGLTFFGDVELHLHPENWFSHGHHKDPHYNQVILHVVLAGQPAKPAVLSDGTTIPCLILQPYISGKLNDVLLYTRNNQELACSGMLHLISPTVIEAQFEKAHQAYFDYRTFHLMKYFDPSLPPSIAWKRMLISGLFEGLGYERNKVPMVELSHLLFKAITKNDCLKNIQDKAVTLSGLTNSRVVPGALKATSWNFSGSRPSNQPPCRIRQAADLYFAIFGIPAKEWLNPDNASCWQQLVQGSGIGAERISLLYGTIYLPSLYILGSLFHDKTIQDTSFSAWVNLQSILPAPVLKAYKKSDFPEGSFKRKLGAVYQYKHYCKKGRCESCFVMQMLLQA